jgi:hypothetical protein
MTLHSDVRGNLKIRGNKGSYRFEWAGERRHDISVGGRVFAVRLTRIKEDSSPNRQQVIYHYMFNVSEQ